MPEGGVAEETGNPGERLEILPTRVLRNHEQEEMVGRLAVDRLEIDPAGAPGEGSDQSIQAGHFPVGNRHSFADPGALQRLPLEKDLEQPVGVDLGLRLRHRLGHLGQNISLGHHPQIEGHGVLHEDIHDLHHDLYSRGEASRPAGVSSMTIGSSIRGISSQFGARYRC